MVTVTSTVPLPAGEVAVIEVAELAGSSRRRAAEVDRRGATEVGPADGHRRAAAGRAARRADRGHRRCRHVGELVDGEVAEVPPGVVTVTSTVPCRPGRWR